ncbi:MAG: sigma-54 dependent transcriptional regulator [Chitinivibrionia bacterium]|nr:sigma-54 dependent transcriptional regulator [Chitinivibrionia bacterium]
MLHFDEKIREKEYKSLLEMTGNCPAMEKVILHCVKIAPTSANIVMLGENGTGKEYFSEIIHKLSKVEGKFVAVNCGAIPENLFESELFGHKKGSFTGAVSDKSGVVEEADNGTLFLDEIADLPPNCQVKLLRFTQERTFRRVGEIFDRKSNCRIIAATNKNLENLIKEEKFREDLYYRLNVCSITLPPLRERKESIPYLITLFIQQQAEKLKKNFIEFSTDATFALMSYDYPGNIRELRNIIEHAAVMNEKGVILFEDLPEYLQKDIKKKFHQKGLIEYMDEPHVIAQKAETTKIEIVESDKNDENINDENDEIFSINATATLNDLETAYIKFVLKKCKNNYSKAVKILGISRSTIWRKLNDEHN